jgi:hypothetical protein
MLGECHREWCALALPVKQYRAAVFWSLRRGGWLTGGVALSPDMACACRGGDRQVPDGAGDRADGHQGSVM